MGDEIRWAVEYALTIKNIHSLLMPMLLNLSRAQYYRHEGGDNIWTAKSLGAQGYPHRQPTVIVGEDYAQSNCVWLY